MSVDRRVVGRWVSRLACSGLVALAGCGSSDVPPAPPGAPIGPPHQDDSLLNELMGPNTGTPTEPTAAAPATATAVVTASASAAPSAKPVGSTKPAGTAKPAATSKPGASTTAKPAATNKPAAPAPAAK